MAKRDRKPLTLPELAAKSAANLVAVSKAYRAGHESGVYVGWHARGRADKKKYGAWREFTGNLTKHDLEKIVDSDLERAKRRK